MPTKLTMPKLHTGQQRVRQSPARFRVLACGRRWGKTRLGSALCIETAVSGGRAWWVAPSYPVATVGWRLLHRLAVQIPSTRIRQGDRLIELPTGGEIRVRSADNPDSLRGEGLDFVVMDECAFMKEDAWTQAIRPALSDRQGKGMFISTPKGRNWFWRLWQNGGQDVEAFRFPTSDNPYIPDSEIEAARKTLPERIFQQEYLAQFIDDAGGVFRGVMDAATAVAHDEAQENAQYVAGVDIGTMNDYTVICVIDIETNQLVAMDRFSNIAYDTLYARVQAINERFMPTSFIVERNAIGQPVIEQLAGLGLPVQGFTTTNTTKAQIIQGLQAAFEHKTIAILNDPILIGELQAFEAKRTASGLMKYEAPSGMHDDTVMALALAWHGSGISWGAW